MDQSHANETGYIKNRVGCIWNTSGMWPDPIATVRSAGYQLLWHLMNTSNGQYGLGDRDFVVDSKLFLCVRNIDYLLSCFVFSSNLQQHAWKDSPLVLYRSWSANYELNILINLYIRNFSVSFLHINQIITLYMYIFPLHFASICFRLG